MTLLFQQSVLQGQRFYILSFKSDGLGRTEGVDSSKIIKSSAETEAAEPRYSLRAPVWAGSASLDR